MIEHSKVELKSWSTKLKRVGEKSSQDKDIVFNNIGHIICREWLEKIYQQMPGEKAVGMDGVTKDKYGKELQKNLDKLIIKIRRGQYQPKPARIVEIPKEDGSTRPLAISCFEDKLVQQAVAVILSAIFEPLFLASSYGFRAGRNCHDALKQMTDTMFQTYDGAVVEIDIKKCFNAIPHKEMEGFLSRKISDSRFLRLIKILMKTPTIQDGKIISNDCGCPQGSIISPVLSNIYLHFVLDKWFSDIQGYFRYNAYEIRYADDAVFIFKSKIDAMRFYKVLPKRLAKYGLEMSKTKSALLPCGRIAALRASENGLRLPVFKFLGFTCYWGKTRKASLWRPKLKSRGDRMRNKLKGMKEYLRSNLNARNTSYVLNQVKRVVQGWLNYHGISDNSRALRGFTLAYKRHLHWWFKRRGGRGCTPFWKVEEILARLKFPAPKVLHPMFSTPKRATANHQIGSLLR